MTVYFQATELESVTSHVSAAEATTAGRFDSTYVRNYLTPGTSITLDCGTALTSDYWFHGSVSWAFGGTWSANATVLEFQSSGAVGIVRMRNPTNSTTIQMEYWNGSAWTSAGAAFAISAGLHDIDIHVGGIGGSSGTIEVFIDSVSSFSASSLSISTTANIQKTIVTPATMSTGWSQFIIADASTVVHKSKSVPATTNGTDTDGTGAVGNINEMPLSDTTYVEFTTAGNKRSVKAAARTLTGTSKAVTVTGRLMRVDATGPQKAKPYLLISGTRYYGTTFTLTTGFVNYTYTWTTNPATAAPWAISEVNDANLEWGWEMVT